MVSSHGIIPRYHPMVSSHGIIPRYHPMVSSHGIIPRYHPTVSSHGIIPRHHPTVRPVAFFGLTNASQHVLTMLLNIFLAGSAPRAWNYRLACSLHEYTCSIDINTSISISISINVSITRTSVEKRWPGVARTSVFEATFRVKY